MKSFEEAIGRNAAASAALCMSMEAVLGHCEKAVKQQGKKVSMEELHSYTAEFIGEAFEIQSLFPQEVLNTDENIQKYNEALWEDIEVAAMLKQIARYKRMTSAAEKEAYCTRIGDIKAAIKKENQRRSEKNHSRLKKNLAFRYWVGDRAGIYFPGKPQLWEVYGQKQERAQGKRGTDRGKEGGGAEKLVCGDGG